MTLLYLDTKRLPGAATVGPGAGGMPAKATLAAETDVDVEDPGPSIRPHPHPASSETFGRAAEAHPRVIADL